MDLLGDRGERTKPCKCVCVRVCAWGPWQRARGARAGTSVFTAVRGGFELVFFLICFFFFFNFLEEEDWASRPQSAQPSREGARGLQQKPAGLSLLLPWLRAPQNSPLGLLFCLFFFLHLFFQFYLQKQSVSVITAQPLRPGVRSRHQTVHFALGGFPFFRFIFPFFFPHFFF